LQLTIDNFISIYDILIPNDSKINHMERNVSANQIITLIDPMFQ